MGTQNTRRLLQQLHREIQLLRGELRDLRADLGLPEAIAVPVEVAARLLGCRKSRIYELLTRGLLTAAPKIGRRRMITRESIESVLANGIEPRSGRRRRSPPRPVPVEANCKTPEELEAAMLRLPI